MARRDHLGMASLFAPIAATPRRGPSLSPTLRRLIVDRKAEYPAHYNDSSEIRLLAPTWPHGISSPDMSPRHRASCKNGPCGVTPRQALVATCLWCQTSPWEGETPALSMMQFWENVPSGGTAHEGVLSRTRVRLRHESLPLVPPCHEEPAAQQEREQDRDTVQRHPTVPARFGRIEEGVRIETHDGPPDE